jgi:hypothetical protein
LPEHELGREQKLGLSGASPEISWVIMSIAAAPISKNG